ncbi:hypothetical protein CS063_11680 [Sporanaerobium hydrogeniformans]|uniref:Uncharacterized protein n=1 Tax=Sporanaerobium hydrogeniformans TaxID=3072179 RepID=A0AC61DB68_9FIRM|nr:CLC_0170 family protein [Sporanaerobium hydrogeniformans]PHV70130.1 hypothetical protein CS063_11680 [Sporanaerobium hydrogeniformans]
MEAFKDIFSIYIILFMLGLGLYMTFIQSNNLIQVNHLTREGQFVRYAGWFYIVLAAIGFVMLWI